MINILKEQNTAMQVREGWQSERKQTKPTDVRGADSSIFCFKLMYFQCCYQLITKDISLLPTLMVCQPIFGRTETFPDQFS